MSKVVPYLRLPSAFLFKGCSFNVALLDFFLPFNVTVLLRKMTQGYKVKCIEKKSLKINFC